MEGYKTATPLDYAFIVRMLIDGDTEGVLVKSVNSPEKDPYPLLDIAKGPFAVTAEGIRGYTLSGQERHIRITDSLIHNVEMREGTEGKWITVEMGSIILLVPK